MPPPRRTALVTGAGRGIGLAIGKRFATDGMRVALLDVDAVVTEAAQRLGGESIAITVDVTRAADVDAAVQQVIDRWGRLDVLVTASTPRVPPSGAASQLDLESRVLS